VLASVRQADVKIGLAADASNTTALHTSIRQGKWRSLQQIIDALLAGRFCFTPASMALVMRCFETMAAKHPREFLFLVTIRT
jgi:hypothetical protein